MNTGRPQAVLLIGVHLCVWFLAPSVRELFDLIELLLELVVACTFKGEAEVGRIGLIPSVGPFALGCITCHKLFLLLLGPQKFEFLDAKDGSSVPDMLHNGDCFLEHSFLETQEIVDVKSHTWRSDHHGICLGALLIVTFYVAFLDHLAKVLQINEFKFAELLPPVSQLTDHNVVSYQTEFDFSLGLGLARMSTLVIDDGVAAVASLSLSCREDWVRQLKNMQAFAFVG